MAIQLQKLKKYSQNILNTSEQWIVQKKYV